MGYLWVNQPNNAVSQPTTTLGDTVAPWLASPLDDGGMGAAGHPPNNVYMLRLKTETRSINTYQRLHPRKAGLYVCSVLLLALVSIAQQHNGEAEAAGAGGAVCSFYIQGAGLNVTAVIDARIQCSGTGPVHLVVDKELLGGFKDRWKGVTTATAAECAMQPCQCLVTIYKGSRVTLRDAVVRDLSVGDSDRTLPSSLLCITGGAQVSSTAASNKKAVAEV